MLVLPANLPPLATHEDVAALTGATYDVAQQGRLTLILDAVSRTIRRECGWHVYPRLPNDVVTVDGSGSTTQLLPTLALRQVHSVTIDGVVYAGTSVEWSLNGYLRLPAATRRLRGVVATVDHGLDDDDVVDLKRLVCELAARGLEATKRPAGLRELATGPFSASWDTPAMTEDEALRVEPFKLGSV